VAFNKVLASLSVVLGSDTKRFEKGMKKSKSELQQFAAAAMKMAGVATAAFTAVAVASLAAAKKAAEFADKIDKAAISSGLSRERLQGLAYVADQAGIEFDSLTSGIAKLNKTMGDAAYGNKRQVEAFEKMGVSIYDTNGQLKSMETVFPDVISALNGMENETERNALSMDLMGRSATQIIPRLAALGDEGIKELMTKAQDLNMIMSDQSVAAFVKYKDGMATVGQQFGALSRNFILPFVNDMNKNVIPVLSRTMRKMSEFTDQTVNNVRREKVELNVLVKAITGANTTTESRARLIKELNEKYPDFLKNLKDEAVNNESIAERLVEVNKLYDQKIKLAIEEQIYKRNSTEIADLLLEETDLIKKLGKAEADRREIANQPIGVESHKTFALQFMRSDRSVIKLSNSLEKNRKRQAELEKSIADTIIRLNEQREAFSNLSNEIDYGVGGSETTVTTTYNTKMGAVDLSGQSLQDPLANFPTDKIDVWSEKIDAAQAQIISFSETVQSAFVDMASGLGESVGNILVGQEDFGDFFGSIKDGFGKFAQDMGKLIIAYGFSMVGFKQAFSNPWAAVAAGTALVAIGTAVRSASQSPDVGGGGAASAAASSYSSGYSGQSQEQTIRLVWERAGKDLVAIINLENNAQNTLIGR
jgi:hypothetical protein